MSLYRVFFTKAVPVTVTLTESVSLCLLATDSQTDRKSKRIKARSCFSEYYVKNRYDSSGGVSGLDIFIHNDLPLLASFVELSGSGEPDGEPADALLLPHLWFLPRRHLRKKGLR